ncbi:MAG: hypothetical protein AUG44_01460 [Actinobacteria bacterium 13_1_20CM_3_71_11]|nr:MAG: hypothetical protein AUG44_01460 [Actinobacteria bacterium 13_1_20CM_3_71_11]
MTPDPDPDSAPEPTEEETEEVFENRAARRAKARSKGHNDAPPAGKGHIGTGRGAVQGPRQWGNRRSG